MIERGGLSCLLSMGVVGLATILLHRVENRSKLSTTAKTATASAAKIAPEDDAFSKAAKPPDGPPEPSKSVVDFVRVEAGERLADVLKRIGEAETRVEDFWRVNRDQIPHPEAPLVAGMMLRTPAP